MGRSGGGELPTDDDSVFFLPLKVLQNRVESGRCVSNENAFIRILCSYELSQSFTRVSEESNTVHPHEQIRVCFDSSR